MVPNADDSAQALVYLISNDYLQSFFSLLQGYKLTPVKVTFSAQALYEAYPVPSGARHYQLYIGYDEIFVSCISDDVLHAVKSFNLLVPEFSEAQAPTSVQEVLKRLGEVLSQSNSAENQDGKEPEDIAGQWLLKLNQLANEIMQFIRAYNLGQRYSLSLHGLFSSCFQWDAKKEQLSVHLLSDPVATFRRTIFLGILGELAANPVSLKARKGINFSSNARGCWVS